MTRSLSIACLAGVLIAHGVAGNTTNAQTNAWQSNSSATETSVPSIPLADQLHGVVKPSQMAELPSLVPGTITAVHVKEGQFVSKGAPLVTLDDRIPRARLAAATVEAKLTGRLKRAEVDLKMAERRLTRLKTALSRNAGAAFEIEEAEGVRDQAVATVRQEQDVLKAAEANRQLAEAELAQYTISAPFDGLVTRIHQKSGTADPSEVLVTVANLSSLEVEMHLPVAIYGTVKPAQKLKLKAAAPISTTIDASVVSVTPMINSASNTFRCLLKIDNATAQRPAGFSVVLNNSSTHTRQAKSKNGRRPFSTTLR